MKKQQPKTVGWRVPPIVVQAMKNVAARKRITLNEYVNRLLLNDQQVCAELERIAALEAKPHTPTAADKLQEITTSSASTEICAGV